MLAEVTLHKSGDFAFESYTDHRETNITLRLRSRTAFILFHQCVPLATQGVSTPKALSLAFGLARNAFTCAELKEKLREHGISAREIRKGRLTDDVRFTANAEGFHGWSRPSTCPSGRRPSSTVSPGSVPRRPRSGSACSGCWSPSAGS